MQDITTCFPSILLKSENAYGLGHTQLRHPIEHRTFHHYFGALGL